MRRLVAVALTLVALPAYAAPWKIDPASTLSFSGSQAGEAFTGQFSKFTPVVEFDPAKPEDGHITVTIDMTSATVPGDKDKTESLPTKDWFYASRFNTATFTSKRITSLSSSQSYVAEGDLTLRGVTAPVVIRFNLSEENGKTIVDGTSKLNRSDFGVGQGQWKDDKWIAYPVEVSFHLIASKR